MTDESSLSSAAFTRALNV